MYLEKKLIVIQHIMINILKKKQIYNTNFYGNKTSIEGKNYIYFFVILPDFIVNADKKYYPQIFLKECKYSKKKKKRWIQLINN